jgi:hypothetical protein
MTLHGGEIEMSYKSCVTGFVETSTSTVTSSGVTAANSRTVGARNHAGHGLDAHKSLDR